MGKPPLPPYSTLKATRSLPISLFATSIQKATLLMYHGGMTLHQMMNQKRVRNPIPRKSPLLMSPRNHSQRHRRRTLASMMSKLTLLSMLPLITQEMSPSSQWPKPTEVPEIYRVFVSNVQVFLSKHLLQNVFS